LLKEKLEKEKRSRVEAEKASNEANLHVVKLTKEKEAVD